MKVQFISLGCKTNQYETNAMEQSFKENGYTIASSKEEKADIYIVNTCSVTNIAERKSRQMLRRAKEQNRNAIIVAVGCYAQVFKDDVSNIEDVDLVLGTNEKNRIVEIIENHINGKNYNKINKNNETNNQNNNNKNDKADTQNSNNKNNKVQVTDVMHQNKYQDFGTTTYTEENRAVIKIQDGCDRFCTYCIIPYARGKVRSRKPEAIIKEAIEIGETGIKEIVLTGIHIASYGKDFKDEEIKRYRKEYGYSETYKPFDPKEDLHAGGFRLIELLEILNKLPQVERIRLRINRTQANN